MKGTNVDVLTAPPLDCTDITFLLNNILPESAKSVCISIVL